MCAFVVLGLVFFYTKRRDWLRECLRNRVVIESDRSRFSDYFLEPGRRFSQIPRIQSESQTIGLPSSPVGTHLLSIARLLMFD